MDGSPVGREQHVVGGQHQRAGFHLRFHRQRHVDGHLVAVEVGVERRANQRVQLDRLAFDQDRLEGLDAQTVQRRRTVQHDRVFLDDFFQDVPHHGVPDSTSFFAALMVVAMPMASRREKMKGLNSSSAISFGRPHWCSLSVGPTTMTERPE
jgi:hypothetical protein